MPRGRKTHRTSPPEQEHTSDIEEAPTPAATPGNSDIPTLSNSDVPVAADKSSMPTSSHNSGASTEPRTKKRKTTSDVWAHFQERGSGDELQAICCSC
ncbi:hypothetical protein Pst134EA_015326 [Puccinia striiformis f. sp. tritici]|uniref:hypothetical protein n=1 Tax=Puccinia striiformis f. sp. tritici TaxID=168172 RepID=UPI002008C12C|nr:hypothetical protein Pst134EA_015326 [Puccinia striiformis f. sp. tritici]KAH9452492.1 hypothetical protein Pst134EB_016444 [Puccinia striiformis f. sp. tritici]KAH9463242.1 hypothetical protein Pst134EA_015326 [Puccinia striiformis f. sp. tritici]